MKTSGIGGEAGDEERGGGASPGTGRLCCSASRDYRMNMIKSGQHARQLFVPIPPL